MASPGLLPLPLRLCFLYFLLLMLCMFSEKFKSGCSETLHPNLSDFEANDHLQMVTKPPKRPPPPPPPSPPPPPPPLPPFTHYIFVFQWPPSVCKTVKCRKPFPKVFTIHGLWPSPATTKPSCSDEKFDYAEIMRANLHKQLDDKWPSLLENKGQQAFLTHEWVKHGTCSGLTQTEYFKTALGLYNDIPILGQLMSLTCGRNADGSTFSCGPHATRKYSPSHIVTAYEEKFHKKIKIRCIKNPGSNDEMIGEIHFKVNKDGKTVESITGPPTEGCTKTSVSFPDK